MTGAASVRAPKPSLLNTLRRPLPISLHLRLPSNCPMPPPDCPASFCIRWRHRSCNQIISLCLLDGAWRVSVQIETEYQITKLSERVAHLVSGVLSSTRSAGRSGSHGRECFGLELVSEHLLALSATTHRKEEQCAHQKARHQADDHQRQN